MFINILRFFIRIFLISPMIFSVIILTSLFYYVFAVIFIYIKTHKNYLDVTFIFHKDTILYIFNYFEEQFKLFALLIAFAVLVHYLLLILKQAKKEKQYYEVHLADISKIWVNQNRKINIKQEEFKYLCLSTSITSVEVFINGILRPAVQEKDISYADALMIDTILFAYIQVGANNIPSVEGVQKDKGYGTTSQSNKSLSRYDILKNIQLIDHVINVVWEIYEKKDLIDDLGTCIIAALTHDIGKIPLKELKKVYNNAENLEGIYTRSHEERGSVLLDFILENSKERELKLSNYDNLKIVKFVIENHHADRLDSIKNNVPEEYFEVLEKVVEADREARIKEEKNWIKDSSKQLHNAISNSEKEKITITNKPNSMNDSSIEQIDYSKAIIIDTNANIEEDNISDNDNETYINNNTNNEDLQINNQNNKNENDSLKQEYPFLQEIDLNNKSRTKILIARISIEEIDNEELKKKINYFDDFLCCYAVFNDSIKNNIYVKYFKNNKIKCIVFKISEYSNFKDLIEDFNFWYKNEDRLYVEHSRNTLEKVNIEIPSNTNTYREFEYEDCINLIIAKMKKMLNTEDAIYSNDERLYFIKYDAIVKMITTLLKNNDKYIEDDYILLSNYFIKRLNEEKNTKYINTSKDYYYTNQFNLVQNNARFNCNFVPILPYFFKLSHTECNNNHKNSNNRFLKIERISNENN
ncbi:hypothetical protein [Campylobacter sp. RM12651]|uniref:hypothetical protein n=1 Tax=Campylobacter sp. RM12651 TaxID=1660079 RepID=UPI001EFAE662|nr:hypothetical protein [Campylobacter sp. RM12651]ULO03847.1 putative membrane protein [Campylobacter sp. RM12651]